MTPPCSSQTTVASERHLFIFAGSILSVDLRQNYNLLLSQPENHFTWSRGLREQIQLWHKGELIVLLTLPVRQHKTLLCNEGERLLRIYLLVLIDGDILSRPSLFNIKLPISNCGQKLSISVLMGLPTQPECVQYKNNKWIHLNSLYWLWLQVPPPKKKSLLGMSDTILKTVLTAKLMPRMLVITYPSTWTKVSSFLCLKLQFERFALSFLYKW